MKRAIAGLIGGLALCLGGCATPVAFTQAGMEQRDKNTQFAIEDRPDGFQVSVLYSRYQFVPESASVGEACKSALTSIAWDVADKKGKKIKPINEQRIQLSLGRNGVSGMTSCSASAPAEWE